MANYGSEIGKLTMWMNWWCSYGGGNMGNHTEGSQGSECNSMAVKWVSKNE